ncbi:MAG TPA: periplasmic heavy metal sensor [Pyrinomonadaceae bacterium]|nr:periplasmic heavy metal sensor [Pyrinomonadaceae bacterium]HMP64997.1 periplasmic heavy metal sensor [Pyrinomonadaceae bacterium]
MISSLFDSRTFVNVAFGLALSFFISLSVYAQGEPSQPAPRDDPERQRPMILRQLGLSDEQIRQFRAVNAEWRPVRMEAQRRFREANRDLDIAIYADVVDDALVAERLQAYQEAQAELTRVRYAEEIAVRKILTPDQLVRFREARRRFAQARESIQRQRGGQPPVRQPVRPQVRQPDRQNTQQRPPERPLQRSQEPPR